MIGCAISTSAVEVKNGCHIHDTTGVFRFTDTTGFNADQVCHVDQNCLPCENNRGSYEYAFEQAFEQKGYKFLSMCFLSPEDGIQEQRTNASSRNEHLVTQYLLVLCLNTAHKHGNLGIDHSQRDDCAIRFV